jgi:hypothetical protein
MSSVAKDTVCTHSEGACKRCDNASCALLEADPNANANEH